MVQATLLGHSDCFCPPFITCLSLLSSTETVFVSYRHVYLPPVLKAEPLTHLFVTSDNTGGISRLEIWGVSDRILMHYCENIPDNTVRHPCGAFPPGTYRVVAYTARCDGECWSYAQTRRKRLESWARTMRSYHRVLRRPSGGFNLGHPLIKVTGDPAAASTDVSSLEWSWPSTNTAGAVGRRLKTTEHSCLTMTPQRESVASTRPWRDS